MSKTPVVLGAAFFGAFVSFAGLIVVWRSFGLGDWGDEHMAEMDAIFLGAVLLGAMLAGLLAHRVARRGVDGDRA